jgi:hypothetical protein
MDISMVTNSGNGGAAVLFGGATSNQNFAAVYGSPGVFWNVAGGGFINYGDPTDYWPGQGQRFTVVFTRTAGVIGIQVNGGAVRTIAGNHPATFEFERFGQVSTNYYSDYDLYSVSLEAPGGISHYWNADASGGTGLVLIDEIGGNDGTLLNFVGDDSQWIEYDVAASVPTGLAADNATETTVDLSWDAGPTGATNDLQWRLLNDTGNETLVSGLTSPSYALAGLASETQYEYRVNETLDAVTSDWSAWFGFASAAPAVADTTAPVITLVDGDVTRVVGSTWTDPGYSATDNVDGDITSNVGVTGTVDTSTAGTYTLNYSVTDAAENTVTATRTVTVVEAAVTTPTITAPVENQFVTRTGDNGTVTVSGTFEAGAELDDVEVRVIQGVTEVVSWTSSTVGADDFTVDIVVPKSVEPYTVEVRSMLSGTPVSSTVASGAWYVGDVFGMIGDSSMQYWYGNGSGTEVPGFVVLDQDGYRNNVTSGQGGLSFAASITAITGAAMLALDFGYSGSHMGSWANGSSQYPLFQTAVQNLAAQGTAIAGVVMIAGYNDAAWEALVDTADALDKFTRLHNRVQTLVGASVPFFNIGVQRGTPPRTDIQWQYLLEAEEQFLQTDGVYRAAYSYDLTMHGDTVHLTNAAYAIQAERAATVVGSVLEGLPYDSAPTVVSAAATSATTTVVTLANVTAITPQTGITGFRFTEGEAISAAVAVGNDQIELTHAALATTSLLTYHFEADPDISGAVLSDTGLPLVTANNVGIADGIAPVITLTDGDVSIEEGTAWTEPGYLATDNEDGDLTASVSISGTVNTAVPGQYVLTYSVTDAAGNTGTTTRTVTVTGLDVTAPVITLTDGDISIAEGEAFSEPGYSANDGVDGDLTGSVVVTGTVNSAVPGTYILTYSVTDAAGNESSVTRTVTVVADTVLPVITLTGGDVSIAEGDTWAEPGFTASDNLDGNITGSVTITGSVNTAVPGQYVLTYSVTDSADNTGTATRTVTVTADAVLPVITLVGGAVTLTRGDTWTEPGFSASDNLDGNITGAVVVTGSVDTGTDGVYTLTYSVTDSRGNTGTATRTVTVEAPSVNEVTGINGDNVLRLGQSNVVTFSLSASLEASQYWEGFVTVAGADYPVTVTASNDTTVTFTPDPTTPTTGTPQLTLNKMALST